MKLSAYELALLEASKSVNATGISVFDSVGCIRIADYMDTNYNYIKHYQDYGFDAQSLVHKLRKG